MVAPAAAAAPAAASSIPAWAGAAGAVLGGMGQFVSGFGGNDRIDMSPMNKAWKRQRQVLTHQIRWRVKDAKRAGLHPLAALGVSPAAGPSANVVAERSNRGNFAQMGQGLQQILQAGQSELQKAQIENLNSRTNYWNKKAADIGRNTPTGQASPVVNNSGVIKRATGPFSVSRLAEKTAQSSHGYEGGTEGFYKFANTEAGGVQVYPTRS